MDALDLAILRKLIQEDAAAPFTSSQMRSLRSIAKHLKVDKETVRKRLSRFEESRFLGRPHLLVHPGIVGLKVTHVWMDGMTRAKKSKAIPKLRLEPSIGVISDCVGDSLNLAAFHRIEDPQAPLARRLARVAGAGTVMSAPIHFPPCGLNLSSLDWRIVHGLQGDPDPSYSSVAGSLGLSARTVKRRLARMVREHALFAVPSFRMDAMDGNLGDLAVFYAPGAVRSAVDQSILTKLADVLVRAELHDPGHSFFNLVTRNLGQTRGIVEWVESHPGVSSARLDFVQERIELPEHLGPLYSGRGGN